MSRRKEDVSKTRGGCRVRGSERVKVRGFTVSHSWHHLDCGILGKKEKGKENVEKEII